MPEALEDYIASFLRHRESVFLDSIVDKLLQHAGASRLLEQNKCLAILSYGSYLRGGEDEGKMADFFLLLDNYDDYYESYHSSFFNRILPPNVYFYHDKHSSKLFDAKYNVISLSHIDSWLGVDSTTFFWARLSQPCVLHVCSGGKSFEKKLISVLACAHKSAFRIGSKLAVNKSVAEMDSQDITKAWQAVFRYTYGAELRTEQPGKALEIVKHWQDYYLDIGKLLIQDAKKNKHADDYIEKMPNLKFLRIKTKLISILRLIKARFTTGSSIDYLIWKIERHSGYKVKLKPWQEKIPLLRLLLKLYKFYRKGAFR